MRLMTTVFSKPSRPSWRARKISAIPPTAIRSMQHVLSEAESAGALSSKLSGQRPEVSTPKPQDADLEGRLLSTAARESPPARHPAGPPPPPSAPPVAHRPPAPPRTAGRRAPPRCRRRAASLRGPARRGGLRDQLRPVPRRGEGAGLPPREPRRVEHHRVESSRSSPRAFAASRTRRPASLSSGRRRLAVQPCVLLAPAPATRRLSVHGPPPASRRRPAPRRRTHPCRRSS